MAQMLIIDDDEIIREGMKRDICWAKHGIEVVGECYNGLEGLDLIKELKPQIVLTDIRMPFMDGLEMSAEALKVFPNLKIIFLTAYEEFDYAKQALQLRAADFILKYADKHEILAAVLKAKEEWEAELRRRELYERSKQLLKTKFLSELFTLVVDEKMVEEKAQSLGVTFEGNLFCVAVIGVDDYGEFEQEHDLAIQSMINISDEILFRYGKGLSFAKYNSYINLLFSFSEDERSRIYTILEDIIDNTKKYLKMLISIGVGNLYEGYGKIKTSYGEAVRALEVREVMNRQGIIPIDSVQFSDNSQFGTFKKIVDFVDEHFAASFSLNEIAEKVHVSHTYICFLFKKYMNCTLSEYLINVRIDKAKDLLKTTDLKAYEVSDKVGYANPQYFSILFKKCTGHSPMEFKKMMQAVSHERV